MAHNMLVSDFSSNKDTICNSLISKAGLAPATQIKVSGCSGMALAHSRRPSMACLSADTAMSQARTS